MHIQGSKGPRMTQLGKVHKALRVEQTWSRAGCPDSVG